MNRHVQRQAQIHQLRHIVRELTRTLPASALGKPELREMDGYGCGTVMYLVRLIAPRLSDEVDAITAVSGGSFTAAYDGQFSRACVTTDYPDRTLYEVRSFADMSADRRRPLTCF